MRRSDRQTFLFTLGVSLFLLLTAAGLTEVDFQGRRLSFGDDTPPFRTAEGKAGETELEIRLLGMEQDIDITKIHKLWKIFLDFSCIPHK